ncbi:MAG: hypothetical protein ACYCX1_07750 [Bellilinea sp.]
MLPVGQSAIERSETSRSQPVDPSLCPLAEPVEAAVATLGPLAEPVEAALAALCRMSCGLDDKLSGDKDKNRPR